MDHNEDGPENVAWKHREGFMVGLGSMALGAATGFRAGLSRGTTGEHDAKAS